MGFPAWELEYQGYGDGNVIEPKVAYSAVHVACLMELSVMTEILSAVSS